MRLISSQLAEAMNNSVNPVNFGLYFAKMLRYHDNFQYREMELKSGNEIEKNKSETLKPCEGEVNGKHFRDKQYGPAREHLSLYEKNVHMAAPILKQCHRQQAFYCRAMEKAGWQPFIVQAKLLSPFVSGLGMSHPTETGLVLDHTSGMPYIPAASQKGVLRIAHMINGLRDENGKWIPQDELASQGVIKKGKNEEWEWQEDTACRTLFGSGGAKDALAGQLVIMDAYPLTPPTLTEEILNPHFGDYYQQKTGKDRKQRGPSEDQSPVPIKFLAIKQGSIFIFRFLLRRSLAVAEKEDQQFLANLVRKHIRTTLSEEGVGAKTAQGFGRFRIIEETESPGVKNWLVEEERKQEKEKYPWRSLIKQIDAIQDNWGQFKQLVLDDDAKARKYQQDQEVALAVKKAAERVKEAFRKKWSIDRDKDVKKWLEKSGLEWHVQEKVDANSYEKSSDESSNAELLVEIEQLSSFQEYRNKNIKITKLDKICAEALQKKFKSQSFRCNKAKKKTPERKAWNQLEKRLKRLY